MIAQAMQEKINAINARVEKKNEEATNLLSYLSAQRSTAHAQELEEEESLKKQGIIIGQHIPSLKTQLNLDEHVVSEFETFYPTLLVAKTLIDQNQNNFKRRTGNLPISDAAELRKQQNDKRKSEETADVPHFMVQTTNTAVRETRVKQRFEDTLSNKQTIVSMSKSDTLGKPRKKLLSAAERIANEDVLKGMNHKLNYLRNPRNDPAGVTRMLVKTKASLDPNNQVPAEPSSPGSPGQPSDSLMSPSVDKTESGKSKISAKYSKATKINYNPLFIAEPSTAFFTNYDVGEKYTQTISFRNISAVTRTLRVLPPTHPAFSITPLRYPTNSSAGMVAPGMSVSMTVVFQPKTLGDYVDEVHVDTESGSFDVHLRSQREPPQLSIPSVLDVGACLVGDATRVSFTCNNAGGGGRFKLLTLEECTAVGLGQRSEESVSLVLRSFDDGFHPETHACMRIAPFTLYPTEFVLMKNESMELTIEFVPLELAQYEETFYMSCDNGQIRKFTLRAESKDVRMTISEINGVDFDYSDAQVFPDVYFQPATIGSDHTQHLQVVNDTGLPIEYEWIWLDTKCTDMNTLGQRIIYDREVVERRRHQQQLHNDLHGVEHIGHDEHDGGARDSLRANRDLLKSLHVHMEGSGRDISTADAVSNRSIGGSAGQFEISPARGVLTGDGLEKFELRFNAADLWGTSMRAVMMVKNVPIAAMPGPYQHEHLQKLIDQGHGMFPRTRSWLEDIGVTGTVPEYTKLSGALSTSKRLINLQTLVHLVVSQTTGEEYGVEPGEFLRISKWVRQLLQHVDTLRNADTVSVDDNSSVDGGGGGSVNTTHSNASSVGISVDGLTMYLQCYDWNGVEHSEEQELVDGADPPLQLPPIRVSRILFPAPEEGGGEGGSEEDADPLTTSMKIMQDAANEIPSLRDFLPVQRELMAEVWLDVLQTVAVMGNQVCEVLEEKVKHEAVDYLKECALNNLARLHVAVYGEGKVQAIELSPPRLEVGGLLPVGKKWEGSFKLINPSSTTAEIDLDMRNLKIESLDAQATDHSEETLTQANFLDQDELLHFSPDYERVLVMPHSEVSVHFTVSIHNTGRYRITLPLLAKGPFTSVDDFVLCANIGGARLRFNCAEIDIGLVGVGGEGVKVISFTNEGDVPAMFIMKPQLHVDISAGTGKSGGSKDLSTNSHDSGTEDTARTGKMSTQNTQRDLQKMSSASRQNTQRGSDGGLSRMSSARSDDFSIGGDSQATSTDFKIELKNAVVTIDPPSGIVAPQQTISVNIVCKAGKIPQRIRGLIESRLFDSSGRIEVLAQYLNMRGEVQAPKTKMYPLVTNLGQVYVGQPVQFVVTVENMCNLPTVYKIARPGGDSSLFKLVFDKPKGPLEAKQKIDITCTFTAIATGMIDDIISNKMFGAPIPLAFVVKAQAKGILVEFSTLFEGMPVPRPLAAPTETQFPNNEKPPEPRPIQPLVIGSDVPLYQRRMIQFVIRNFSAIPAVYELNPKKFKVIEKVKRFPSSASAASVSSAASSMLAGGAPLRDDLILAPHEHGTDKFQSEAGKKYIGFTVQQQEDRQFLHSGLGASYLLDVTQGVLPPWGVQVVTVRAFNDIPGCYDDDIECRITEGSVVHLFSIPITMSIVGCPIVIEKDTVGMTVMTKGEPSLLGKPMLQLGYACVHCEPLVREFFVKNHGSKNGRVKWQVKSLASKTNGPVKLSLKLDGGTRRVKPVFQFWEDIARDSPYKIEPEAATIPPYGKQRFVITLFRTNSPGRELAQLTGAIVFSGDAQGEESNANSRTMLGNTSKASLGGGAAAGNKFSLTLLLEGLFLSPSITIDKNTLVTDPQQAPTLVSDLNALNLKTAATTLFAKGSKIADVCQKPLTITNPTDARLLFNVSTEGPFIIRDPAAVLPIAAGGGHSAAAQLLHQHSSAASITSAASLDNHSVVSHKSSIGKTLNLLPNESSSFQIAFNPKRDLRDKLMTAFGKEAGNPAEQRGKLIFSYATGQSLHVPIVVKISTPFLAASSPRMYFGVCHTSFDCEGTLLLTNPTQVPACWTVTHVVGEGAWRRTTAIRVAGFADTASTEVDDPSVFEISPTAGVVLGPTVSVVAAVAAPPKDFNRNANTIVPQRVVKSSWATNTLSLNDSLDLRHSLQHESEADAMFPMPVKIKFTPNKNVTYSSRFRFSCEFANTFDLVLQGKGTYEEQEHKPLNPMPK